MSLVTQINNLATRIGTEIKAVRGEIGTRANLTTTAKSDLVAAVNEIDAKTAAAGAQIDDAATSTSTVWSSSKVASITGPLRTDVDAATATAAAKPSIDDTTASSSTVYSGSKVESVVATAVGAKPSIDDGAASTSAVWSSSRTDSRISEVVGAVVDAAPAALDTLNELSAALGADPNFSATVSTALGNRVRVDAAQSFTAGQQQQGRANIGAVAAADVGDTAADFVAVFENALL